MPKAAPIQASFNAGEFSPALYGRVDSDRYKAALATCLNYIPTLSGPLIRRPGTVYVTNTKYLTSSSALIPFQFSATQGYIIEVGNQYLRFYTNDGQIIVNSNYFQISGAAATTSGQFFFYAARPNFLQKPNESFINSSVIGAGIYEVPTPYLSADISLLRWSQNADTLYLTHPNYPTMKLQRFDFDDWKLSQIYFQDGPYLPLNSYKIIGDSATITLVPGAATGLTVLTTGPLTLCSSVINNGAGVCRVITQAPHGYFNGQQVVVKNVTGAIEANTYTSLNSSAPKAWTISIISATSFDLSGSIYGSSYISGGIIQPSLFTSSADSNRVIGLVNLGQRYWGVTTAYLGDNSSIGFWIDQSNTLQNTSIVLTWYLGCYGGQTFLGGTLLSSSSIGANGYVAGTNFPATSCFHQNRLVFAGSPNFPQQVDGSYVGQYENFAGNVAVGSTALSVTAANAFQFTLNSSESNALRWLKSTSQGLLSGSYSSEWNITPNDNSGALSPTNVNALQTSFYGVANIDAVQAGNATLYVQRSNKKVREMNYFFQLGTFRSTDLTELSDHITLPSVSKLVVQKETYPLIWGIRGDGNLVTMSYNRDDQSIKAGWARHQLGGQSDSGGTNPIVNSLAVIQDPTASFDQLWMIVQRSLLSGSTFSSVEYMTRPFDDSILQEDAFQLDCGITYNNALTVSSIATVASSVVITSAAHGLARGTAVKIYNVVGLNQSTTDSLGNQTVTNLVNEQTFSIANVSTNTFTLFNFASSIIMPGGYSAYVSGGLVRPAITNLSGLSWLPGETVGVLADGSIHPDVVVTASSAITLSYPAFKVQIGYRYNSDGMTLRPEAGSADGSSIGQTRRPTRAAFQFHRLGDFAMGTNFKSLIPFQIPRADVQAADQAPPLYSGIYRDGLESSYDFEGQICFRQNSPLPGMIQSVTLMMEEQDV